MYIEIFLLILGAVVLYGLTNSTEKVLTLHKTYNEESKNLMDYHSRL